MSEPDHAHWTKDTLKALPGLALVCDPAQVLWTSFPLSELLRNFDTTAENLAEKISETDINTNKIENTNAASTTQTIMLRATEESPPLWLKIARAPILFEGRDAQLALFSDITEERNAASSADAAAQSKSAFLATISHEIRTPLQSVFGLLELIVGETTSPRIQEMATRAQRSASGLLEILDDVLDLAKIEAGRMELDDFEVPLRTLTRGVIEAYEINLATRPVQLRDDVAENVPAVIRGDPKRLRQILINLTSNALKFTEKGSVTLRLRFSPSDTGHGRLRFEVQDTGHGMSPDVAARLFQPFTQADSSTSRNYGGTGLGLSICRKLVELMEGEIGVTSTPGEGSTFWFDIPAESIAAGEAATDLPQLDGLSILSVEDHPQAAREIVQSLRSMGASVESCANCAEARDLIHRRPFDVAIVDQSLPDGVGLDLIREMIERRPAMGLIMYTAREDLGLEHALQALGATYLTKPASRKGLGEAVASAANAAPHIIPNGTGRLLIAEDTAAVRDVLQRQLEVLHVSADFAENGREALDAITAARAAGSPYTLLISDLHMPDIDGYGLAKALRQQETGTDAYLPIVVMTADVQMAQRQVFMSHGFDECLLKPATLGQFRRLLTRWGFVPTTEDTPAQPAPPEPENAPPAEEGETSAIDRKAVIEQIGAWNEEAIEMLRLFITMTTPLLEKMAQEKDLLDLAEHAHSLKGAAHFAGCTRLGKLAADLQNRSEANIPSPALLDEINKEFERVRQEVNAL